MWTSWPPSYRLTFDLYLQMHSVYCTTRSKECFTLGFWENKSILQNKKKKKNKKKKPRSCDAFDKLLQVGQHLKEKTGDYQKKAPGGRHQNRCCPTANALPLLLQRETVKRLQVWPLSCAWLYSNAVIQ